MKRFARALFCGLLICAVGNASLTAAEKKSKSKGKKTEKTGAGELNIPIPIGHGAQGVRVPYYDDKGKLQMMFSIVSATRVDDLHLQMQAVIIETYDDAGGLDLSVDAKSSVLDLSTRIVTSDQPATIRRSDFEITGDTMQFNTKTREGNMSGNVRMLIYNSSSSEATASE